MAQAESGEVVLVAADPVEYRELLRHARDGLEDVEHSHDRRSSSAGPKRSAGDLFPATGAADGLRVLEKH